MNRIDAKFLNLKRERKKAFMPFVTAGDPTLEMTVSIISKLESVGADLIELGIPFSDPVADGSSIQKSSLRSLSNGTTLNGIFRTMEKIRSRAEIPIAFMTYYNIIFKHGLRQFVQDAVGAGVDGVIVPDLPPEEAAELISIAREHELATIFLLTPTSTAARIEMVSSVCTGFIYCVSLTGVTGARERVSDMLAPTLERIRMGTDKPIAVGFGVSTPDQAKEVAKMADGVIVGSAIVNVMEAHLDDDNKMLDAVGEFAADLVTAVKSA